MSKIFKIFLSRSVPPYMSVSFEVRGVPSARDAIRVAFARVFDDIAANNLPGPIAAWRFERAESDGGLRVISLRRE